MQYFDHSTQAATDPAIMQLRLECGGAAVDAYWYLVEQMHRDERPLCVRNASAMRVHCHTLCTDAETLESWLSAMVSCGLIRIDDATGEATSKRAMGNIEAYKAKADKARAAAQSRWGDANAKRTHSKRNASAKRTQCQQNKTKQKDGNAIQGIANPSEGAPVGSTRPSEGLPEGWRTRPAVKCGRCGSPIAEHKDGRQACPVCDPLELLPFRRTCSLCGSGLDETGWCPVCQEVDGKAVRR